MTTILFACRKNAGRSQIAAALAERDGPADITILSAGTDPADDVHPVVRQALAKIGLAPHSAPEKLDAAQVEKADWVITTGCGETCSFVPGVHYEDWDVDDPADEPIGVVRQIRDDIEKRVANLFARIS